MSKILIDAGRSSRGWSRIGSFFRCPQLFAYQNRLDMQLIPAGALTRGSMGHVLQAHQHAIWGHVPLKVCGLMRHGTTTPTPFSLLKKP